MPTKRSWFKYAIVVLATFGFCGIFWFQMNLDGLRFVRQRGEGETRHSNLEAILATDERLRQLSRQHPDNEMVPHPQANQSLLPDGDSPKMNSVRELLFATEVLIDIESPCGGRFGDQQTVAVLVFSRAADERRRRVIRETYGQSLKRFEQTEIYFVVGIVDDASVQTRLQNESAHHGDILQFALKEDYYNLTLKSTALLRWTALHCHQVRFVFKLDDDCFLRVRPLLGQLESLPPDSIYGRLLGPNATVLNRPSDKYSDFAKWYIDPLFFPHQFYPIYIGGNYLIPGWATAALYEAIVTEPTTDTIPALPFDDAYVTGILAQKVALPRKGLERLLIWDKGLLDVEYFRQFNVLLLHGFKQLDEDLKHLWAVFGEN